MIIVMLAGLPGSSRGEAAAQLADALAADGKRTALLTMGGEPTATPPTFDASLTVTHHTTEDGCVACHSGQALMRALDGIYRAEQPDAVVIELSATALPDSLRPYVDALADVPVEAVRVVVTAVACGPALAHQQGLAFLFEALLRSADAVWLPESDACSPDQIEAAKASLRALDSPSTLVTGAVPEMVARLLPGVVSD